MGDLADWLSAVDDVESGATPPSGPLDDDLARALAEAIQHGPSGARPVPVEPVVRTSPPATAPPTPAPDAVVPPWLRSDDETPKAQTSTDATDPPDLDDLFATSAPQPRTVEGVGRPDDDADAGELFAPDALPPIDKFLAVIESREAAEAAAADAPLFDDTDDRAWVDDLKSWVPADDDILPASAAKTRAKRKPSTPS